MGVQAIHAAALNQWVVEKEPIFMLDVRNADDFADWKIEGEAIVHVNVPYYELLDGIDSIMEQVDTNRKIIVVCAKEGSSSLIAHMIGEKGLDAYYLEGGMKSWSEHLYSVVAYQDEKVQVHQIMRVGKGCLSYVVISGNEALVVDPQRFTEEHRRIAAAEGATITHIVDSHLHADHISGGYDLACATGASYYVMKCEGAIFDFKALEDYDRIQFGDATMQVIAVKTPGHTPGSVSFFVNDSLLFSGDTIFVSGLGRPDLGGKAREWAVDLYDTIYSKVSQMADDVLVLPSHYASYDLEVNEQGFIGSRLGDIRTHNDMMTGKTEEQFIDFVAQSASTSTPPNYEEIILINRGVKEATEEEKQELEIGPNRCAVHHTN